MSSTALEALYQRYRNRAAFFVVNIAERSPQGFWLRLSDDEAQHKRATAISQCPEFQQITVPFLLDDQAGTADYLYRVWPFRLCIIDIDGKIAYHSPDGIHDHDDTALDKLVTRKLDALLANNGHITKGMIAADRRLNAGAPAWPIWLPKVEYFAGGEQIVTEPLPGEKTERISDAHGYPLNVTAALHEVLIQKRIQVARLFTGAGTKQDKPAILLFLSSMPSAPTLAALADCYQRHHKHADFYLVYSGTETVMSHRVAKAKAMASNVNLPMPCLIDSPQNEITTVYGNATPRLLQLIPAPWRIRLISEPGEAGLAKAIAQVDAFWAK